MCIGIGTCLTHKSHDLEYVGRHDLRIKALNKSNTNVSTVRSASYLSYREVYHIHTFNELLE